MKIKHNKNIKFKLKYFANMEIFVYKGLPGLPSIDFDCLRVLTYIKLSEAPVKIIHNINPIKSNSGFLPYITNDGTKISGYKEIIKYLKEQGFDINKSLSYNDEFIALGLMDYIYSNINPTFQYIFWGNPQNVSEVTLLYAKQIPFPFNMYYPKKYITKAYEILEVMTDIDLEDKIDIKEVDNVIFTAKSCITFFARKLEKELWFLKSKPTEFDIAIYAYLALLTKIKLPNNPLESHILEFPNLVNFIDRINKKYFSDDIYKFEDQQKRSKSLHGSNSSETNIGGSNNDDDHESRRTQMISLACAVLAMVAFAVSKGMLSFSYNQSDDKYIEYYDEDDNDDDDYN